MYSFSRRLASVLVAAAICVPHALAFNATAQRANCTSAQFDLSLSLAEFRATTDFELRITTPSGESKDGIFPILGTDPSDPLFVYPTQLSTSIYIRWKTPMQSGGNSSWVFTLYNGTTPILYPGRTYIDTGTAYQYVDCTPPVTASGTSTASPTSTDAGGTSTSTAAGANPTASTNSGTSGGANSGGGGGGGSSNAGAIAGGVVGGVLGLALIGVLAAWLFRRNKHATYASQNHPGAAEVGAFDHKHPQGPFGGPGAPASAAGVPAYQHSAAGQHGMQSPVGSDGRPMSAAPSASFSTGGWTQGTAAPHQQQALGYTPSASYAHGPASHASLYGVPAALLAGGAGAASPSEHARRMSAITTTTNPGAGAPPSLAPSASVSHAGGNPLLASLGGAAGASAVADPSHDGLPAYEATRAAPVAPPEKAAHIRAHTSAAAAAAAATSGSGSGAAEAGPSVPVAPDATPTHSSDDAQASVSGSGSAAPGI